MNMSSVLPAQPMTADVCQVKLGGNPPSQGQPSSTLTPLLIRQLLRLALRRPARHGKT